MMSAAVPIDYLTPDLPASLPQVRMPVIDATPDSIQGYGKLVQYPDEIAIEIVQWPAQGRRPVDPDTGNQGGIKEGVFHAEWKGDVLYGRNEAVGGHYVLAYAKDPSLAREDHVRPPQSMLLWHANYHPDGGQLFYPIDRKPFYVPLALPGDDVKPEHFVCFRFDGSAGLYIHPGIWHEGIFPLSGNQRFIDRQGAVHARVSVQFAKEFHCLLVANI
ncbi:ureidoglycolate lyase [Noviherbaspirillum malthae]|jgi:hypothetical protein|uniref:ureidoglycolate lyase n=1 Tax=Noviherbaspirillum malthae TaxID=1260987 RepID=UPI001E5FD0CB|nr:ureidoglycolate lyase [Noviherbaspirillum malthae]